MGILQSKIDWPKITLSNKPIHLVIREYDTMCNLTLLGSQPKDQLAQNCTVGRNQCSLVAQETDTCSEMCQAKTILQNSQISAGPTTYTNFFGGKINISTTIPKQ